MIVSLVLKDRYALCADNNGKFILEGKKLSIKDIPFIRYRFDDYSESDIEYIRNAMNVFKHSTHLAEVTIKDGYVDTVKMLNDNFENLAVYLYLNIYDSHVQSCALTEKDLELLAGTGEIIYDRLMIKDRSNSLHAVSSVKLKNQIAKATGFESSGIGICDSPLSFGPDACLTAVKARELSSIYCQNDECALPSANHECMNRCGCIKYIEVGGNLKIPVPKTVGVKKEKVEKENNGIVSGEEDVKNTKKKRNNKAIIAW